MTKDKNYFNKWNGYNTLFSIYLGSNDISIINFKKSKLNKSQYVKNNKTIDDNIIDIIDL